MSLTVPHYCLQSLNVSPSGMELLHISHHLPWLLAFSHCLSGPMELLHVSHCLLWLLAVSHCLSQYNRVAACLSLSPMVACYF